MWRCRKSCRDGERTLLPPGHPAAGRVTFLFFMAADGDRAYLKDVAEHNALSPEEVISIHSGGEYLVYFLGFTPGYPFMGGMSEKISTPRLPSPRVSIPAGSVGIANNQTGIYPVQSPGGWRLIGCTPMRLYDPEKENPFLLESGDKVFFEEITEEEFEEIEKNNETWNIHSSQRIKG